jgi:hypothetical protein
MGDVLKAMATQIRQTVPHSSKDEGDLLSVDGTLTVVLVIPAADKPAPAAPAKAAAASKKTSGGTKRGRKANGAATAEPAVPAEDRPAIPLKADADEGEPAKLPPAVPTVDADADPDNI